MAFPNLSVVSRCRCGEWHASIPEHPAATCVAAALPRDRIIRNMMKEVLSEVRLMRLPYTSGLLPKTHASCSACRLAGSKRGSIVSDALVCCRQLASCSS